MNRRFIVPAAGVALAGLAGLAVLEFRNDIRLPSDFAGQKPLQETASDPLRAPEVRQGDPAFAAVNPPVAAADVPAQGPLADSQKPAPIKDGWLAPAPFGAPRADMRGPGAASPSAAPAILAYAPDAPASGALWRDFNAPLPAARPREFGALPTPAPGGQTDVAPAPHVKGAPLYIRVFKREGLLELWAKRDGRYALQKTWPICKWSGQLGPKQKYADYQSPEGFYAVSAKQLKPNSNYFRAFDVGYPNAYDRQLGRTGGLIMVHGECKSVGCFAMTNKGMGEIYGIVEAALKGGAQREIPVHIFPFRMTDGALAREAPQGFASLFSATPGKSWGDFWRNLKEGYDLFERTGEPPVAYACQGRYKFGAAGAGCTRIAGW